MRAMALPLPLLVLGVALADHTNDAAPLDHLAVFADGFDAGTNLQRALAWKNFPVEPCILAGPVSYRKGRD